MNPNQIIFLSVLALLILFILLVTLYKRYKLVPNDRYLVLLNKKKEIIKVLLPGSSIYVLPFTQDYEFMDLTPIPISVSLNKKFDNINHSLIISVTICIIEEEKSFLEAANRFLNNSHKEVHDYHCKDVKSSIKEYLVPISSIQELDAIALVTKLNKTLTRKGYEIFDLKVFNSNKDKKDSIISFRHPKRPPYSNFGEESRGS